jgi:hypothetical protein
MDPKVQAGKESLEELVAARVNCLRLSTESVDRFSQISLSQYQDALRSARSPRQRLAIGAVWARRLAETASTTREIDAALFRFAQHLRASATNQSTMQAERPLLDAAALDAFGQLRSTPREYRGRTPSNDIDELSSIWIKALGLDRAVWSRLLDIVGEGIRVPTHVRVPRRQSQVSYPAWLTPPGPAGVSSRLIELATWRPASKPEDVDVLAAARAAYEAFLENDFAAAREEIRAVEDGLSTTWGPTETTEGRAFFAWVRALPLIDAAYRNDRATAGHHLLSAVELLHRTSEPAFETVAAHLLDRLLVDPTGDHVADLDWAAHRFRLSRLFGHEVALDDLDNPTKAGLRSLWKQGHSHLRFPDESTVGMVAVLDEHLGQSLTHLQTSSDEPDAVTERALLELRTFCDAEERGSLESVSSAIRYHLSHRESRDSMQVLREMANLIEDATDDVRESGSLLIQEAALPLLARVSEATAASIDQLSTAGGPDLLASLITDRLPLLHGANTPTQVHIQVRNAGTMPARNVLVRATQSNELNFSDTPGVIGDIPAGAERVVALEATVLDTAPSGSFTAVVTWDDDYDREGERAQEFFAEAERESSWADTDRNPFQLSSIEDPERLIGRDEYIRQFLDIARSGGSMYVTGLKRVGKTSLVRVALTLLEREGSLTVYLPLGRALGPDPSAADLVMSMLDKLEDAATAAFPELSVPALDSTGSANFSRLADRWLSRLRRALPAEMMAIIALDDFDELPTILRSGDEGDALFLFLRTLVDESWISVTFIGSEVLPTLLSQQSQRLNQVDPIQVQNFGSRESTGDLLRRPSASRFDWTEDAIDSVHALTEGNPYFATILGGRVWTMLRERGRTLAQVADVASAADRLAATETQSHFMHLWSDDPEGLDAASPRAIRSSAVLRAVARCSTTPGALVDRDEVVAVSQQWIPGSTMELLQESCSSLVRRGVVHETDTGQLRLRIPVVGTWLLGAGGRHLDEVYRESSLARPASKVVAASDYRALARNLSYQARPVSTLDLQGWVEQLPDPTHQYLAFQMLRRACSDGYFSQHRVQTEVVPRLTEHLRDGPLAGRERRAPNNYLTSVLVLDHGSSGSSAPAVARQMLSSLRIAKAAMTPQSEIADRAAAERPSLILVLDEFAGTGRQLSGVVRKLAEELSETNQSWAEETTIAVGIGVVPGTETLSAFDGLPCEVAVGVTLGPEVRAFDDEARIFDSESDRIAAMDLMGAVGRGLSARPPLGFQDQGLLVVFESNCPNNSLPALWKNGDYSGREWIPLFERLESRDRGAAS